MRVWGWGCGGVRSLPLAACIFLSGTPWVWPSLPSCVRSLHPSPSCNESGKYYCHGEGKNMIDFNLFPGKQKGKSCKKISSQVEFWWFVFVCVSSCLSRYYSVLIHYMTTDFILWNGSVCFLLLLSCNPVWYSTHKHSSWVRQTSLSCTSPENHHDVYIYKNCRDVPNLLYPLV